MAVTPYGQGACEQNRRAYPRLRGGGQESGCQRSLSRHSPATLATPSVLFRRFVEEMASALGRQARRRDEA